MHLNSVPKARSTLNLYAPILFLSVRFVLLFNDHLNIYYYEKKSVNGDGSNDADNKNVSIIKGWQSMQFNKNNNEHDKNR